MKKIYILLLVLLSFSWSNAQGQGSDVIILIDNSSSMSHSEFNNMISSIELVSTSFTSCNSNNRFAAVHYGDNNLANSPQSRITIQSDFTNDISTIELNDFPSYHGDFLHDTMDLISNALDPNATVSTRISPAGVSKLTRDTNNNLVFFIFTDAYRNKPFLDNTKQHYSFLVNYQNSSTAMGLHPPTPSGYSTNDNFAITNYITNKNQPNNAKFVIIHVAPNSESEEAGASIASSSTCNNFYSGATEDFTNDPDRGNNRYYFLRDNFLLTPSDVTDVSSAICEISNGACINLNTVNLNCPSTNFNVPGTYSILNGGTLSGMTLRIRDNLGTIIFNDSTNYTTSGGNSFTFTVDPNTAFGTNPSGDYEFEVEMSFTINSNNNTVSDVSSNNGADVSFNNCCSDNITITNTVISTQNNPNNNSADEQKAANLITAVNTIENGGQAAYRALEVKLESGFYAATGSIVRLYTQNCDSNNDYSYRQIVKNKEFTYRTPGVYDYSEYKVINNSISNNNVSVYPNPNNGNFKVTFDTDSSGLITITDMNGRIILTQSYNVSEVTVDMTSQATGFYIIKIVSGDNVVTKKLIKK